MSNKDIFLFFILINLLFVSCFGCDSDKKKEIITTKKCNIDSECENQICEANVCVEGCKENSCGEKNRCDYSTKRCVSTENGFYPEKSDYPKLFFTKDEIENLKNKSINSQYLPLYNIILNESSRNLPNEFQNAPYPGSAIEYSSSTIKSLSFIVMLNDNIENYNKIINYYKILPDNLQTSEDNHDILFMSAAITNFCKSYDFLKGSSLLTTEDDNLIKTKITNIVESLFLKYATETNLGYFQLFATHNNWNIKFVAAMGIYGLTFNNLSKSFFYISYGITELKHYLIDSLTTDEGGYSEGPNYHRYSQSEYLPFLIAINNFLNKNITNYYNQYCLTRRDNSCVNGEILIDNFINSKQFKNTLHWQFDIVMPDGFTPPFDDNIMGCSNSLINYYFDNNPEYIWYNEEYSKCKNYVDNFSVETFVYHNAEIVKQKPVEKNFISPKTGVIIFRNAIEANNKYFLLVCEDFPMRGMSHEHSDETTFSYHAFGDYLLLDSGYIKYTEREKVNKEKNHSLLLIDNEGPTNPGLGTGGAKCFINGKDINDDISFVSSQTTYKGHTINRFVFSIKNELFIIFDMPVNISGRHNFIYSFTAQLNGGEDERGIVELFDKGVILTKQNSKLRIYTISSNNITNYSTDSQTDGILYGQEKQHKRFIASSEGENVNFLTLFDAQKSNDEFIDVSVNNGYGFQYDERNYKINFNEIYTNGKLIFSKLNGENIETSYIINTNQFSNKELNFTSEEFKNIKVDYVNKVVTPIEY